MTVVPYLCPICHHNTTTLEKHIEHFGTHKPEKLLFLYPSKPGEINTRIGHYYVELPTDLPMKTRSQILRAIDKAVEEGIGK